MKLVLLSGCRQKIGDQCLREMRIRECGPEAAGKGGLRMIHICLEALVLEAGCYRRDMVQRRATRGQATRPDAMSGG